jgi:outer membrane protein OmpA-like peptidoglycan-associated protein
LVASRTETNVTANHSFTATFAIDPVVPPTLFTLTYTAGSNGSITGASSQSVASGANGTAVTAVAVTGFHFVSWSDGSLSASRTELNVTSNQAYSATFAPDGIQPPSDNATYVLSYSANTGGSISGDTAQTLSPGADGSTVTAVAQTGYHFVSWSDGRTSASRTDTNVLADHTYTANFAQDAVVPITHTVSAGAGPNGTVVPLGSRVVNDGDTLEITITPDANYHVATVFVDGVSVGTPTSYTFSNITADHTLSATFAINSNGTTGPGGGLPTNPDGSTSTIVPEGTDGVKATESGVNDPVVLSLIQGGTGVQLAAKDWLIQIASDKKQVYGIQLPTKIQVYVIRGVNATTNGTGFLPGTIARVYLYSTRTYLGEATVQANGTFAAHFPVSAATTLGYHVMQVEGTAFDGKFRTAAVGLQVIAKPKTGLVYLGTIYYGLNVSKLNATNIAKVAAVIASATQNNFKKVWIYGFTDRQTGVNNQVLSRLRSSKISNLLNAILPKSIVGFKYFGPANPKDAAHTEVAYAQNRRSEIWAQP